MLSIKVKDEVITVSRIACKTPNYISDSEAFQKMVYALADDNQRTALKRIISDGEKEDATDTAKQAGEKAEEKLEAIVKSGLSLSDEVLNANRLARAFAIGIGFIKCNQVLMGFDKVYDLAMKYAVTYKESTSWTQERKDDFTKIREAWTTLFQDSFGEYMNKGYQLKLSSKAINTWLDAMYTYTDKNGGKGTAKTRATAYKRANIYEAFKLAMQAVNVCTGASFAEKVTTITVF